MAFDITAAGGTTTKSIAADVVGTARNPTTGEQVQEICIVTGTLGSPTIVTSANPLAVASLPIVTPTANFTRPSDTTQYASGDLVANNTTAGSVTPLSWATAARTTAGSGQVLRARLTKSTASATAATFRLHLYAASPTCTNGDNGVWLTTQSGYLGSFDLDASSTSGRTFSDPALEVIGVPTAGSQVNFVATATTIYGLVEARSTYTPASAEVFTVILEIANPN
jgi:hypothetical protein